MLVRYLLKDFRSDRPVYANFGLNFKYTSLDVLSIMEMEKNKDTLDKCTIGIDEMTVFLDCRRSSSKMNRLISYFVLQSRKRDTNLYYTSQDLSMIDLRLYNHTDIIVYCEKLDPDQDHYRKYTVFDLRNRRKPTINRFVMGIEPYYKYYDTNEIILPPI